jgi:hypothetical protein
MSDIQMITPKKTKADIMNILNSYSFSDEEINRLKYIYTKEWEAYKKGISTFLENQGEEILNIEGMSLMLSKITSNKPDSDYEYKEKLFSEEKRSIFCQWLFKSHIMALEKCDRKIGNHIDHHLPIILHLYLNEGRAKRLQDPNLDMQFKIDDYNKLSNLIIDKINEHLGEFYEIDIMEPITTEGPFDYIVANLKMITIYQQSEDTYIKTFLNSLMNKISESSSVESFTRSEELFGLFGKNQDVNIERSSEGLGMLFALLASYFLLPIVTALIVISVVKMGKNNYNKLYKKLLKKLSKEDMNKVDAIIKEVSTYVENFIKTIDKVCEEIFKDNNVFAVYNSLNHIKPVRIKQKYAKYANIVDSDEYRNSVEKNMNDFVEKLLKFVIIGKPLLLDSDTKIIRVECIDNGYVLTETVANKLDKIFDKAFKCAKGVVKSVICERPAELHYKTVIYNNDSTLHSSISLKDPSNSTGREDLEYSEELFGLFGKKKKESSNNNNEIDYTKLPGFKQEIFDKVHSLFKNAWNYHAYKLPTDVGDMDPKYKEDYDNESAINDRKDECGFEKTIKEFETFRYKIKVKGDKLVIHGEGIYSFAWGQPTEFPTYNKTLTDISTRWNKRLTEKQTVVKDYLSKHYKSISITTNVGIGDGDEGAVYPEYTIEIPISEFQKPIKKSKEELLKLCETGTKILIKAFQKNGNPKGFTYRSKNEINEQIDDYLSDNSDGSYVIIGDLNAWEFTNGKARDESEYEKYNNVLINIENDIKDLMKQMNYPCNITSDGSDWDDGNYVIKFNTRPNFEKLKNYMS